MNIKKIIILLLSVCLIFSLASCKKDKKDDKKACSAHVDANDDYKCDNCGVDFEDGAEVNEAPVVYRNVTFSFKLEDGTAIGNVKFTIEKGSQTFDLQTDANGNVTKQLATGAYSITCDYTTIPEYCSIDTYAFKVNEQTSSIVILVTNNTPDGTASKPFPTVSGTTSLELAAGQVLYFVYHGASMQYVKINSESVVVNFNGESYSAVDGVVTVAITPAEIGATTIFTVQNTTNEAITVDMEMVSPLGSLDNPIAVTDNSISKLFAEGEIAYYKWTADKDGVLIAKSVMANADISLRRNIVKIVNNEEIIIPLVAQSDDGSALYMYVKAGDEIIISLTPSNPKASTVIDVNFEHYEGSASDPVPTYNTEIVISIDAGKSVVFSAVGSNTVSITDDELVTVKCDGATYTNEGGKLTANLGSGYFEVINNTEDRNSITIVLG